MRKKVPRSEPEMLVARIESFEQTYYLSEYRTHGAQVDEEALIDIVARIERTSPRHKAHCGEHIGISLACAQTYREGGLTPASDRPLLLSMNLKKNNRSFMAYLPSAAFWAIPRMIETRNVTHIHVMFAPLHRGHGELLSVYLIPESKLDEL
jgi:hypothetical protein